MLISDFLIFKNFGHIKVSRYIKEPTIDKYERGLNEIPKSLLNRFLEQGSLYIMTKVKPKQPKVRGMTTTKKHSGIDIYLNHKEYNTMPHEFGHVLDFFCDCISESEEFQEIYEKEKEAAHIQLNYRDYHLSNSSEYFAQSFRNILCYKDMVREHLPETYNFIMKCLETI